MSTRAVRDNGTPGEEHAEEAGDGASFDFGFPIRPALRLGLVEKILGAQGIIQPVPSRQRLIDMIERGELEGKKVGSWYIVYEDSFKAWVKEIAGAE